MRLHALRQSTWPVLMKVAECVLPCLAISLLPQDAYNNLRLIGWRIAMSFLGVTHCRRRHFWRPVDPLRVPSDGIYVSNVVAKRVPSLRNGCRLLIAASQDFVAVY